MADDSKHKVTFYVVFDAEVYGFPHADNKRVRKVRPKRMLLTKPSLAGGEIALKFQVNVPDAAFLRLIPDVAVDIPDGFWTSQPVEVIVADPTEGEN